MRELSEEFAVRPATLAALRIPEKMLCVGYRKSTVRSPLVSVVVPTRNRRRLLGRAVASVLALADSASVEVVVVDDGSIDGSSNFLRGMDDPRISAVGLLRAQGGNTARNVGIAIARAPVVAFLDSDDVYTQGRLSDPLSLLASNPDVGVVISSFCTRKGQRSRQLRLRERTYDSETLFGFIASYVLPPCTSGLTVRRELLLACRGFDPAIKRMQDRDLLLRLAPLTKGASSAVVSWQKHWHSDGISSQRSSYYDALCAFVTLHPVYEGKELKTRNYLIARHMIALAKDGLLQRALAVYQHARTGLSPRVQFMPLLLLSYVMTRIRRRRASAGVRASAPGPLGNGNRLASQPSSLLAACLLQVRADQQGRQSAKGSPRRTAHAASP